jgi:hypothetical protein
MTISKLFVATEKERIRALTVATPDLFNKRMIGVSIPEMDELALTLCRTRSCCHSQPHALASA